MFINFTTFYQEERKKIIEDLTCGAKEITSNKFMRAENKAPFIERSYKSFLLPRLLQSI